MNEIFNLQSQNIDSYLESTDIIDFEGCKEIKLKSLEFKNTGNTEIEIVNNIYRYVRDEISHSADIEGKVITCKASEVIKYKQGICYAKSHLLTAMLRFLGYPTGLCYQKLILDDDKAAYIVLHGINAVYLKEIDRWIRLDARGNKEGINAQFSIENEKLAFPVRKEKGEEDIWIIFSKPDSNVIKSLNKYADPIELYNNLPKELADI